MRDGNKKTSLHLVMFVVPWVLEVTMRDGNFASSVGSNVLNHPGFRSDYEGWKLIATSITAFSPSITVLEVTMRDGNPDLDECFCD